MKQKVSAAEARAAIPPLMFEFLRLWKQQFTGDTNALPSFLHAETLRFISEQQEPSMRTVAVYLKIAPPSATALVNSMVEDGLLSRKQDPEDRRMVRLALTKKGIDVLEKVQERRTAVFANLIHTLSDEDCCALARILTRITTR